MSHHLQDIRAEILELAAEDYLGLWEVAGDFRKALPGADDDEIHKARSALVAELLESSLVRLSRSALSGGPVEDLVTEDAIQLVGQESSWADQGPDRPSLWLTTTQEGEREASRVA